jgi:hypothetical protein
MKDRFWLRERLERRAKDARQAEEYARRMHSGGYPDAQYLADVHARVAAIYEQAVIDMPVKP